MVQDLFRVDTDFLATLTIINIARFHTYSINYILEPLGDRLILSYVLPGMIANYNVLILAVRDILYTYTVDD